MTVYIFPNKVCQTFPLDLDKSILYLDIVHVVRASFCLVFCVFESVTIALFKLTLLIRACAKNLKLLRFVLLRLDFAFEAQLLAHLIKVSQVIEGLL